MSGGSACGFLRRRRPRATRAPSAGGPGPAARPMTLWGPRRDQSGRRAWRLWVSGETRRRNDTAGAGHGQSCAEATGCGANDGAAWDVRLEHLRPAKVRLGYVTVKDPFPEYNGRKVRVARRCEKIRREVGRDDRIRTCDPLTPSQVRYQAALHPESVRLKPDAACSGSG